MQILKSLFYHFYLFYSRIYIDDDPILKTKLSLAAVESLIIIGIFDIISAKFLSAKLDKWLMIVITLLVLLINTFYFFTEKKVKEIIQEKPLLFNSKKFSVIFAWSFFAIGIIIMFFLSSVVYKILN